MVAVTIAVDMMGGDGEAASLETLTRGVAIAARAQPAARFLLHGAAAELEAALAAEKDLAGRAEIRDAPGVVSMDDKPGEILRNSAGTSMAAALDSVAAGAARAAVSCGNTGALMALSVLKLKRLDGVIRPAIAVLWPSVTPGKQSVVLDVGADVRLEPRNLCQFAAMGASFAQIGLGVSYPRVGLLNIGSEHHKGKSQLQDASAMISEAAIGQDFDYVGFIEANEIPMDAVDVVVTDGFTGNVALKAAEGTARLIKTWMKASFQSSPLARAGGLLAAGALREMSSNLDPGKGNGGVFLGLSGLVVKSHGSVDAKGFAAAVGLAAQVAEDQLIERLAESLQMDRVA